MCGMGAKTLENCFFMSSPSAWSFSEVARISSGRLSTCSQMAATVLKDQTGSQEESTCTCHSGETDFSSSTSDLQSAIVLLNLVFSLTVGGFGGEAAVGWKMSKPDGLWMTERVL
jgi:hypothetical protein